MLGAAAQVRLTVDVTEDRRNSFPAADQKLLATLRLPLLVTVHLAPEDPRYADLQRNVLAKLERAMPNVSVTLARPRQGFSSGSSDDPMARSNTFMAIDPTSAGQPVLARFCRCSTRSRAFCLPRQRPAANIPAIRWSPALMPRFSGFSAGCRF